MTDGYWILGLLLATVGTAALVNRFRPTHRSRVRRVVILFLLYAVAGVGQLALEALGNAVWTGRFGVAAELLGAFACVNLAATLAFSIVLPRIGINMPMIASDLLVGIGYLGATLGVLTFHGFNPAGALASAAVVSAVLAISLQSTLGNILGGVALQLDGSVHEGDWVQLENGKQGRVRAIRWRHTVVETRDWSTIIVPNSLLLANNITILGKRDGREVPFRMWVWFNVDFRYAPTKVIQVVTDALNASSIAGVADDPPPNCVCMDFTRENRESFASYAVRFFLTDLAADDPTASRVRTRIFTALQRANIPFGIPASTMWVQIEDEKRRERKMQRTLEERVSEMKHIPLFRHFTTEELGTLAEGLSEVLYTAGETITRQGAVAHYLYLLTTGRAEIRTTFDPDGSGPLPTTTKALAQIEAPEVFGEMGLMTGEPRNADVVALTDVECLRLGKDTFERVLLARPEIANELSDRLAAQRVENMALREVLDEGARQSRVDTERERILTGIKSFFGL